MPTRPRNYLRVSADFLQTGLLGQWYGVGAQRGSSGSTGTNTISYMQAVAAFAEGESYAVTVPLASAAWDAGPDRS